MGRVSAGGQCHFGKRHKDQTFGEIWYAAFAGIFWTTGGLKFWRRWSRRGRYELKAPEIRVGTIPRLVLGASLLRERRGQRGYYYSRHRWTIETSCISEHHYICIRPTATMKISPAWIQKWDIGARRINTRSKIHVTLLMGMRSDV